MGRLSYLTLGMDNMIVSFQDKSDYSFCSRRWSMAYLQSLPNHSDMEGELQPLELKDSINSNMGKTT